VGLWKVVGAAAAPAGWYERLAAAYAEPQRHYHNQRHIAECLAEFDQARHLARQPETVEFALWFHDTVYDPRKSDNEEQSAALAKRCLAEAGVSGAMQENVNRLVIATKSHETETDSDAGLVMDVDLSIFGQQEQRFSEYEQQIRQEYAWVPRPIFNSKRREILKRFVARDRIYATEWFRDKYEQQARRNLQASIAKLKFFRG
jgi:predicted metal-dependent HD superfamily phosphohydrolase